MLYATFISSLFLLLLATKGLFELSVLQSHGLISAPLDASNPIVFAILFIQPVLFGILGLKGVELVFRVFLLARAKTEADLALPKQRTGESKENILHLAADEGRDEPPVAESYGPTAGAALDSMLRPMRRRSAALRRYVDVLWFKGSPPQLFLVLAQVLAIVALPLRGNLLAITILIWTTLVTTILPAMLLYLGFMADYTSAIEALDAPELVKLSRWHNEYRDLFRAWKGPYVQRAERRKLGLKVACLALLCEVDARLRLILSKQLRANYRRDLESMRALSRKLVLSGIARELAAIGEERFGRMCFLSHPYAQGLLRASRLARWISSRIPLV